MGKVLSIGSYHPPYPYIYLAMETKMHQENARILLSACNPWCFPGKYILRPESGHDWKNTATSLHWIWVGWVHARVFSLWPTSPKIPWAANAKALDLRSPGIGQVAATTCCKESAQWLEDVGDNSIWSYAWYCLVYDESRCSLLNDLEQYPHTPHQQQILFSIFDHFHTPKTSKNQIGPHPKSRWQHTQMIASSSTLLPTATLMRMLCWAERSS